MVERTERLKVPLTLANEVEHRRLLAVRVNACLTDADITRRFHIDDFGAAGDGVTDDSQALEDAFAALGARGGIIYLGPKAYLFDTGFTVPPGVGIQGEFQGVFEWFEFDGALGDLNTVVYLNPAETYTLDFNTAWTQCSILKKGVVAPTSQAEAEALVASFAGTALTIAGRDICLDRLFIGGFNRAIDWDNIASARDRPRFSNILADCINPFRVGEQGELGTFEFLRCYPALTSDPVLEETPPCSHKMRDGIAFDAANNWDWGTARFCNFFNWKQGWNIVDSNNLYLENCSADVDHGLFTALAETSIGIELVGNCNQATLQGFRCAGQTEAIRVSTVGARLLKVIGGQFWDNDTLLVVTNDGPGSPFGIFAGNDVSFTSDAGQATVITLPATSGAWSVYGNVFVDLAGAPVNELFDVDAAVLSAQAFQAWGNLYINCNDELSGEVMYLLGGANAKALIQANHGASTVYMGAEVGNVEVYSLAGEARLVTYASTPVQLKPNNTTVLEAIDTLVTASVPVQVPSYTVGGVPSASPAGQVIYVSNETGGAVLAFSDNSNWRRVTDRAIVA